MVRRPDAVWCCVPLRHGIGNGIGNGIGKKGRTMRQRVLLLLSLLLPVAAVHAEVAREAERPNVLFVIADDLGIGDLRCYGNPHVDTPAIDSLVRDGVLLTDHYAPSPLCAPSRAGFLTGRFNHRTGAVDVPSNRGLDRIVLSEKTFGDHFRNAGYATALIGKWHNGLYCSDYLPHHRGFDLFFGFPNGGQDYWKWNLLRNDEAVSHDGRYLSDALNDEAISFVRATASKDRPFALFLAHHAPHSPFQAPDALIEKYRQRLGPQGSDKVAIIYAMIEAMDKGLGRVLQELKEQNLWKKTIVVFTSDNGAYLGNAEGGSTRRFHAGFSGNKGDVGEQGIRVPCIVSWPGHIPGGRKVSAPIHGCDWLPTLFSLTGKSRPGSPLKKGSDPLEGVQKHDNTGCPERVRPLFQRAARGAKPFDGLNVMPTLLGRRQPELALRNLPFQKNRYRPAAHSDAAIRRGPWKLVWPGVPATMKKDSARDNPSYLRGIVWPHWEMPLDRELGAVPKFEELAPRLFDLSSDPGERHDLAKSRPKLVAELRRDYDAWFQDVMLDWRKSRRSIIEHDRQYWRIRAAPNAAILFKDFWQWQRAALGTDPRTADPLKVFPGYWTPENQ